MNENLLKSLFLNFKIVKIIILIFFSANYFKIEVFSIQYQFYFGAFLRLD